MPRIAPVTTAGLDDTNRRRRHREVTDLMLNFQHDDSRIRTPAEVTAGITPLNYAYAPEGQDFRRYGIVGNFTTDDTVALQALSNFIEGGTVAGTGRKLAYNGGRLRMQPSNAKCTDTFRLGGNVHMVGDHLEACAIGFVGTFTGKNCIELGPDESGIYGWNNQYTMGTAIESMTINSASDCDATIYSAGVHQGSHLRDLKIRNVNKLGIDIEGIGGSAYFKMSDINIDGGASMDANAVGIYTAMGSVVQIEQVAIQGSGGAGVFKYGIHIRNGGHNITNLHTEDVTTAIYLDPLSDAHVQVINNVSANSSVARMLWIPVGYTGAVNVSGLLAAPGSIGIQNDDTGEADTATFYTQYIWADGFMPLYGPERITHIRAHKTSAQSMANNTLTKVTFPTEDVDTLGEWVTDTFTAKYVGPYLVAATVQLVAAAWGAAPLDFEINIYRNGSVFATESLPSQAALTMTRTISISKVVILAKGDTIDIRLLQGSGGAINTGTASNVVHVTIDRVQ